MILRPLRHSKQNKQSLSFFGAFGAKSRFFAAMLVHRTDRTAYSASRKEIVPGIQTQRSQVPIFVNSTKETPFIQPIARQEAGFTIAELMIATAVFAVVLLIVSFGILQISRTYYKGITSNKTQEAARSIIDDISRSIQFGGGTPPAVQTQGTISYFCVATTRYSYIVGTQVVDSAPAVSAHQGYHGIVRDTASNCSANLPNLAVQNLAAGATELLSVNMRLAAFQLNNLGNNLFNIQVKVISGDDDVLDATRSKCSSVRAGTQFCSVSDLNTVVQKRI